jgi:peptidyl-prolyl cis-trans isomerase D
LKESVTVSDQELQRFYNDNKDRFRVEDRVKASHILFKTTGKTPEEIEAVRKKAEDVLKRVRASEDFAKLAKEYSDDAQTTAKGGDLGWIVRGQTVPEFEKAAFSLPIGSISDLIKTVYGFHILKIEGRERARLRSLQEVAAEITPQVKAEKATRSAEDLANRAESSVKKSPNNLPAVAAQLSAPVLETDLMKRGDPLPQVGPAPAADENLFAANLKPGQLTPVITVPNGFTIAALVQVSPAHAAELAEVRAQVENDLKNEKAAEIAASRMKELAELARKDGDLKKAATALKMPVKESEPFASDGSIKDLGSASALGNNPLAMKTGDLGGPATINDGAVVFQVTEKLPASTEELAKSREAIRKDLADQKRNASFEVFADSLKTRMEQQGKLKIDRAALDRLTSSYER